MHTHSFIRIDINTKAGKPVSVMQCSDCGVLQVKVNCVRAGVCLGPAVEATPASAPDPSHGQEEDE